MFNDKILSIFDKIAEPLLNVKEIKTSVVETAVKINDTNNKNKSENKNNEKKSKKNPLLFNEFKSSMKEEIDEIKDEEDERPIITRRKKKSQKDELPGSIKYYGSNTDDQSKVIKDNKSLIIKDETAFWKFIEKLDWKDKSDGIMNIHKKIEFIKSELSPLDIIFFKNNLNNFMKDLRVKFKDHHLFAKNDNDSIRKQNAFLSHIIAKGELFYVAILDDICFADYLIQDNPEYQDLYECLP